MSHFLARRSGAPGNECDHRHAGSIFGGPFLHRPADLAYQYDENNILIRPLTLYSGPDARSYMPLEQRGA